MNAVLLSLLLLLQGVPIQPTQSGTVTGVLRTADGKPAVNERVTAIPQVEFAGDAVDSATLSSLAITDEQGRYILENVPPGRYYIAAGRLDLQTFYPGTQAMNAGQTIRIAPGAKVEGINFTLNATSAGRSVATGVNPSFVVPLDIRLENGGKFPVSSGGKFAAVKLTSVSGAVSASAPFLSNSILSLPPGLADYRITFEGLPEDYRVKTIRYGTTPLPDGVLRITNPPTVNTSAGGGVTVFTLGTFWAAGAGAAVAAAGPQPQTLSIVFDTGVPLPARGARVRGSIQGNFQRLIYLSGTPGTVYADGTFEFRNVAPGRHVIMTLDNPPATLPLVASFVVGTADLNDVTVATTPALPLHSRTPSEPVAAPSRAPGALPLATVRGRILDSETDEPLNAGTVFVVGESYAAYKLSADGKFEFHRLLPGKYELEVQGVGYPTIRRAIVVEEEDLDLELKAG